MGIPFTGTSVNPARSLGPALFSTELALQQVWVFILAPILGGILAALFYRFVINPKETAASYVFEVEETDADKIIYYLLLITSKQIKIENISLQTFQNPLLRNPYKSNRRAWKPYGSAFKQHNHRRNSTQVLY